LSHQQTRAVTLDKEIGTLYDQLVQAQLELHCFESLRGGEVEAVRKRVGVMQDYLKEQVERESDLQRRYANLVAERENLLQSRTRLLV